MKGKDVPLSWKYPPWKNLRGNSLRRVLIAVSLTLLPAMWLVAGCSSPEASPGSSFSGEITLCRKISRKSGRPIGVADEFKAAKKSYVNALVEFNDVRPDRDYTVHLVWVRPDGKDLFMKYAEVRQTALSEQEYQTVISWLDAEDLHKVRRDTVVTADQQFDLKTRLNISTKKNRTPGLYHFRVYLDRRFYLEKPFTVISDPIPDDPDPGPVS